MLTDLSIKNLIRPDRRLDRRKEIPDGKIGGLYFVLQPTGAASWAVRYRTDGKPAKLTLGSCPAIDLATARRRVRKPLAPLPGAKTWPPRRGPPKRRYAQSVRPTNIESSALSRSSSSVMQSRRRKTGARLKGCWSRSSSDGKAGACRKSAGRTFTKCLMRSWTAGGRFAPTAFSLSYARCAIGRSAGGSWIKARAQE